MARVLLVRGAVDYEPRFCDQCGRQVIFGPVYVVVVEEVKYRVCSFECERNLKISLAGVIESEVQSQP